MHTMLVVINTLRSLVGGSITQFGMFLLMTVTSSVRPSRMTRKGGRVCLLTLITWEMSHTLWHAFLYLSASNTGRMRAK